ncbi:MAG: hypothetical protein RR397_07475 [Odoribacter sp.]
MKRIVLAFIFCIGIHFVFAGPLKKTYISATVSGYSGSVVDFEFMGKEDLNMQYAYVENKQMEFEVELDDIVLMKLNAFVWIYLQPGDKINAAVQYDGRFFKTVEFTGTPEAVIANRVCNDMRSVRIENRYKLDPRAAAAVQTAPHNYYAATQKEWKVEKEILEAEKVQIPSQIYNYMYTEIESQFLSNLITYPMVCASMAKESIEKSMPEGFWTVLDDYKLREDEASLKSGAYMSFLLDYKNYVRRRDALKMDVIYTPANDMKSEFEDIASFYEGSLREGALYFFLCNQIMSGKDFDTAQKLSKQYLKKYNQNKEYRKNLTEMMK